MPGPKFLTHLFRPLRLLDRRSRLVERLIEAPLTDVDERPVRLACEASRARLGEFYHWYLQKYLVSRAIRGLDSEQALSLIASVDATDYAQLRCILDQPSGVLVAVPHHGHYIFSIIAMAEHLRHHRKVYVFYGQPTTHQGNEVFDALHSVIWGEGQGVEVIHDTRQGMAKAMRGLKNGDVVVIMPDVFKREEDTLTVPFCGRAMNVMLGTAILARKTGAWVLPAVAAQHGRGMGFRTWFGNRIDSPAAGTGDESADQIRIMDYDVIRELFDQYEPVMSPEIVYWQFMRQHLARPDGYHEVPRAELAEMMELLARDPALAGPTSILDLRSQA